MALATPPPPVPPPPGHNDVLQFPTGKRVCGRWKVVSKLGAGGCGSVYRVEDLQQKGYFAALKVEPIQDEIDGVLKLEAAVLRKLQNKKCVIRLLHAGKRHSYNFIVLSLCGSDLITLRKQSPEGFCESTILRIGVHTLYAIKQLHEIGYVHRDVKPGNVMNGSYGRDARSFFLIDYGMTRSFIIHHGGQMTIRPPRKQVLLRGTLRYCSLSVHKRHEQGRVDDLWAMLYMLTELYCGVPWNRIKAEPEIAKQKETVPDEEVFKECPKEFIELAHYFRTLTYQDRPDYYKIYELFINKMHREEYTFGEVYDWEKEDKKEVLETAVEYSEREKKTKKSLNPTEVEYLQYPNIHPRHFKENVLKI